jgi:hypothetical protein
MLRCVNLVRTDVSEERRASIIRVKRIGELGTTLAVTSSLRTLRRNAKLQSLYFRNSVLYFSLVAQKMSDFQIQLNHSFIIHISNRISL